MKKEFFLSLIILLLWPFFLFPGGNREKTAFTDSYNAALEYYRNGDFDKTVEILDKPDLTDVEKENTERMMLLAAGLYRSAEKKTGESESLSEALDLLERSVNFLSETVHRDPWNKKAANNLEMVMILKEKIEEKKASEQNNQDNSGNSMEDELQDLADRQKQLADDENKESSSHRDQQEELNMDTEEMSSRSPGDPGDFSEKMEQARQAQQQASEALKQGEYSRAAEKQQEAADALQDALATVQGSPGEEQKAGEAEETTAGTENIIDAILNSESDRENSNNEITGNGVTVERDW